MNGAGGTIYGADDPRLINNETDSPEVGSACLRCTYGCERYISLFSFLFGLAH